MIELGLFGRLISKIPIVDTIVEPAACIFDLDLLTHDRRRRKDASHATLDRNNLRKTRRRERYATELRQQRKRGAGHVNRRGCVFLRSYFQSFARRVVLASQFQSEISFPSDP
jgi:hypothetical protein